MMKNIITLLLTATVASPLHDLYAQSPSKEDYGRLQGGIESNGAIYKKDPSDPESQRKGDNTYINLRYTYKDFNAGLQYETFEPPMLGYEKDLKGHALTQYYANYSGQKVNLTLGSFYEQFGSGLLLRAYEERSLGINNSLRGLNIKYTPTDWASIKVIGGQPRRYLTYADAFVAGIDTDLSIAHLWTKERNYDVTLGGSWLSHFNTKEFARTKAPKQTNLWGLRTGFSTSDFTMGIEYTQKGASQSYSPHVLRYLDEGGDALLVNADYTLSDFGISAAFRRIEHMDFRIDNLPKEIYVPMNYIPALTKQHKYALPGLYPYQARPSGEIGGQVDIYHTIKNERLGKYPLKIALNASHYRSLGYNPMRTMPFWGEGGTALFSELALEVGKKISRSLEINGGLYYQKQYYEGQQNKSIAQVLDILWKITRKYSLRSELQHMTTDMKDKGWIYGLAEVGLAPRFAFYGSLMYSYAADAKQLYYTIGSSFTYNSLRASLSYGRNREGIQCVGGICRFVPEYTGITGSLSYPF
ncbi:DUF6029 family protein [Porphyromonas sp.]|uniref:DUF6029 family protein n=1 Tax=Porphyromonas sp. TaxID=1924944 RepID=UPI0026DB5C29|nr:DUF6029 family protein [Porphyromonas sp.]MDO4695439.1 DUF6029 family protein [Porphyromonas sp.]MDO4771246.1 DUF6029 family protein [Porphyromonas sp.]